MNFESMDQARKIVSAMPFASAGQLDFELLPVGPFKPLGLLLQGHRVREGAVSDHSNLIAAPPELSAA